MAKMAPNKRRLNNLFLKALPAKAKREKSKPYLIWDEKMPGLAVQVRPSGRLFWKVIYQRHRRPRWFTIGEYSEHLINLTEAHKRALAVLSEVSKGNDPQAERIAKRGEGTFKEMYEGRPDKDGEPRNGYLQHAKIKNKSWYRVDKIVRRNLLPEWSMLRPAEITRGDVKRLLARIKTPVMYNSVLMSASAIFSWMVSEDLLTINPCIGISKKELKSRGRFLSDSEIPKFCKAFDDAGMEGMALKFLLVTGQRPGEVRHLRTEHVAEDGWWEMPGEPEVATRWPGTKNALTHRVFLPAPARDILAAIGADGFVFGGVRGGPINRIDAAMREICEKLEVPPARPHDLRRTHGTLIASLKFGTEMMNRVQNHIAGGIGAVYNKYDYADEKQNIMETVAAKIAALVDGKLSGNVISFGKPL